MMSKILKRDPRFSFTLISSYDYWQNRTNYINIIFANESEISCESSHRCSLVVVAFYSVNHWPRWPVWPTFSYWRLLIVLLTSRIPTFTHMEIKFKIPRCVKLVLEAICTPPQSSLWVFSQFWRSSRCAKVKTLIKEVMWLRSSISTDIYFIAKRHETHKVTASPLH